MDILAGFKKATGRLYMDILAGFKKAKFMTRQPRTHFTIQPINKQLNIILNMTLHKHKFTLNERPIHY